MLVPALLAAVTFNSAPVIPWSRVSTEVAATFAKADGRTPTSIVSDGEGPVTSKDQLEQIVERTRVRFAGKPGQVIEQRVRAEYSRINNRWELHALRFGGETQLSPPIQRTPPPAPSTNEVKFLARKYIGTWVANADDVEQIDLDGPPNFFWVQEGRIAQYRFASQTRIRNRKGGTTRRLICPFEFVVNSDEHLGWFVADALCDDEACEVSRQCIEEKNP